MKKSQRVLPFNFLLFRQRKGNRQEKIQVKWNKELREPKKAQTKESDVWRTDPQTRRDNSKEKLSCSDLKILQKARTPDGDSLWTLRGDNQSKQKKHYTSAVAEVMCLHFLSLETYITGLKHLIFPSRNMGL